MSWQQLVDPVLDASMKGFPQQSKPLPRSAIGRQGWNVLRGDLPLPLAIVRRRALVGNLKWMQDYANAHGVGLAPHGKTTMSPQLFRRQLDAGAYGLTFASVTQLHAGIAAGARRFIIANQVFRAVDLQSLESLKRADPDLQIAFLLDSGAQLDLIEKWHAITPSALAHDVLIEVGVPGGRTGCRSHEQALALARRVRVSPAARLVGLECYEGLGATGNTDADTTYAQALMERVRALAQACDGEQLFESDEILLTAGGSAIFDLVVDHLTLALSRPVRGLLRSGCYVTHDHGSYQRFMGVVAKRMGCGHGLQAALEVCAVVQSCPEPGLAILGVGKRDISYDLELPQVVGVYVESTASFTPPPADWRVVGLNDQHAYLRGTGEEHQALKVGDLVLLGISHPCTTFDKWRWIPVVDDDYTVCDAIVTCF